MQLNILQQLLRTPEDGHLSKCPRSHAFTIVRVIKLTMSNATFYLSSSSFTHSCCGYASKHSVHDESAGLQLAQNLVLTETAVVVLVATIQVPLVVGMACVLAATLVVPDVGFVLVLQVTFALKGFARVVMVAGLLVLKQVAVVAAEAQYMVMAGAGDPAVTGLATHAVLMVACWLTLERAENALHTRFFII